MTDSANGCGLLWDVFGPPPIKPTQGLLAAAAAALPGVRVIPDADDGGNERWMNGIEMWPYPTHTGDVFNPDAAGSDRVKAAGESIANPRFFPFVGYVGDSCSSLHIGSHEEYRARILDVFDAVESSLVARQLMTSSFDVTANPHLADGRGTVLGTPVSLALGLALLETAIARSSRGGLIHVSPKIGILLGQTHIVAGKDGMVLRTILGTPVIVDPGYVDPPAPVGHGTPADTQEWIYASGPVDVRRSRPYMLPDNPREALDRSNNNVTYRAENEFVVAWDTAVQAAVLVDFCADDCA